MAKKKVFWRSVYAVLFLLIVAGATFYHRPLWVFHQVQFLRLRIAGVESRKIIIDGHKIHYYVRGPVSGAPIVLVHGLGGRAEDWVNLAPFLEKAGYRVYTPDLLGFGQSEEPADASYSISGQAKVVEQFFDAMGLKQADLAGWSM